MDYYKILGLNKNCSDKDIKKSYKKLALQWHPDRNPQNPEQSKKKFQQISEAYRILSDKKLRKQYDLGEEINMDSSSIHDPFDIFESFFNNDSMFFDNFNKNNYNNFNNRFQNNFFSYNSNNYSNSSYSSRSEKTRIVNGYSVKETIIEDGNKKTEIYEVNGIIRQKKITENGKILIYNYDNEGKYIKDN